MKTDLIDGVSCGHKGCLSHISHPCEGCGRFGGRNWDVILDNAVADRALLEESGACYTTMMNSGVIKQVVGNDYQIKTYYDFKMVMEKIIEVIKERGIV